MKASKVNPKLALTKHDKQKTNYSVRSCLVHADATLRLLRLQTKLGKKVPAVLKRVCL